MLGTQQVSDKSRNPEQGVRSVLSAHRGVRANLSAYSYRCNLNTTFVAVPWDVRSLFHGVL